MPCRASPAGGEHRVVLEKELQRTSVRVLFNGCYVPAATAVAAGTMTELTVTLPEPADPRQGLTLVHFSAQLKRILWDRGASRGC